MREQSEQNLAAWNSRAGDFWRMRYGEPKELAEKILKAPKARLRHHAKALEDVAGLRVANVCGSNARIAVPLAVLGARVTVFDLSEDSRAYALELARCAGVEIGYVLGDFLNVDLRAYGGKFDLAYMEGGVLHYFEDLPRFCQTVRALLAPGGRLILSDFHPFRKLLPPTEYFPDTGAEGDYFERGMHEGPLPYARFFPEAERAALPTCRLRFYTLSEILNAVLEAGFVLRRFDEHPHWEDAKLPGEFTLYAGRP